MVAAAGAQPHRPHLSELMSTGLSPAPPSPPGSSHPKRNEYEEEEEETEEEEVLLWVTPRSQSWCDVSETNCRLALLPKRKLWSGNKNIIQQLTADV